jgi:hypothetical protein
MAKLLCWIEQIQFLTGPTVLESKTPDCGQRFLTIVLRGSEANVGCLILPAVYYAQRRDSGICLEFLIPEARRSHKNYGFRVKGVGCR